MDTDHRDARRRDPRTARDHHAERHGAGRAHDPAAVDRSERSIGLDDGERGLDLVVLRVMTERGVDRPDPVGTLLVGDRADLDVHGVRA
jgi:hypothetical protein